ncbi:Purine permease 21 [Glycine soja]|uniref:Probable purine permease n=1 Tax=Glycine soja TaxID=3848 RepID=A0A445KK70_GLYSO|nr:Purine permease 21 [Glycine soja]
MTTNTIVTQQPQHSRLEKYKRWLRVSLYTILLLAGQCSGTLLVRFYFVKGGKSIWIQTSVQSAGFPILIPLLFHSKKHDKTNVPNNDTSKTKPKLPITFFLYLVFGLMIAAMDLTYACALLYLPLSTFALVCASQLIFNAVLTFFINSQKFTALILNSIIVLTISVTLIALNTESEETKNLSKQKQIIGFFCALGASAIFALHHSLMQFYFEKIIKTETFSTVLSMIFYPMIVGTIGGLVGLLVSGDWRTMGMEMKEFENGSVSYVMTLVCTSVTWQIGCVGQCLATPLGSFFFDKDVFVLSINAKSEDSEDLQLPKEKQIIGFFSALAASATFSLHHSLVQLCSDKDIKRETFSTLLGMLVYPMIIVSCGGIVGLFASGDGRTLGMEMKEFENGRVSYVITLLWNVVRWQLADIGNMELTIAPILGIIVFHDKFNWVKAIAFFLAL